MTSNIESTLKKLNREELLELAHTKKINIPKNWSTQFIIELLSLNIEAGEIHKSKVKSVKSKEKTEMAPIIIIKNLQKRFENVAAIDGLNLEIRKGELFSLLGPNGAGKTTTINILTGIAQPTKGNAVIDGFDITRNASEIKKIIGVCPQEATVYSFLNAKENIELFGKLHSLSRAQIEKRANRMLDLLGLADASQRRAGGYSGGMLRKLNLIMALINDPKIAFLDEPTVGMDARARRNTWEFIGSLKGEDKTIVLTTHYIEEAEALSDRVGIIDYGKLIELGTPEELIEKYGVNNLEQVFLNITGRRIVEGL